MPSPPPKPNRFFQTALVNPAAKMTLPAYRSATGTAPSLPSGTIKITVGSDPITSRTWHLARALLIRHSTHLAKHAANPYKHSIDLPSIDPRDFANFVDYMHSSIYSLNEHVPGYRALRQNTAAALLGIKFGSKEYADAATRRLHMIFASLTQLRNLNARKSLIRASDIEYVCAHTGTDVDAGLRRLYLDAVASHWTQTDVINIGAAMVGDLLGDTTTWSDVYKTYPDFRVRMAKSLVVMDAARSTILKPVETYLGAAITPVIAAQPSGATTVDDGVKVRELNERGRPILRPRSRIPSFRRAGSGSSERQRVERAENDPADVQGWREEVSASAGRDGEVDAVDNEWEVVDADEA